MKLKFGKSTKSSTVGRLKKKARIRKKISGTAERPRLSVYRSLSHIYAQLIDDDNGATLASTSTLKMDLKGKKGLEIAALVGKDIAAVAGTKKIEKVIFDRNGFIYHGKIKAVADAARENGLKF